MSTKILVFLFLFGLGTCPAQIPNLESNNGFTMAPPKTDIEMIETILHKIKIKLLNGKAEQLIDFLGNDIDKSKTTLLNNEQTEIMIQFFQIKNVEISVNGDYATVKCSVYEEVTPRTEHVILTLKRFSSQWKITNNNFIVELILYEFNKQLKQEIDVQLHTGLDKDQVNPSSLDDINTSNIQDLNNYSSFSILSEITSSFNYVSAFSISSTALIQKSVPWSGGLLTVNRATAQQYVSKDIFGNPVDGQLVNTSSDNYVGVVIDDSWERLVYGDKNGVFLKSYGDNPGDQKIKWPRSVSLDRDGNIFVLCSYPSKLVHLKYDESSQIISFIRNVPFSNVNNPEDFSFQDANPAINNNQKYLKF